MSRLKCRVGQWTFHWKTVPKGSVGVADVEIQDGASGVAHCLRVQWRRDRDGFWILLPSGARGFDLKTERDDLAQTVYQVTQRGGHHEWINLTACYGNEVLQTTARARSQLSHRVRAQMPGKILRILVKEGEAVQKGQSLVIMEAMKMENEIRASQPGNVGQIKVIEGQVVETGADLLFLVGGEGG